jgi:hypothetical protein
LEAAFIPSQAAVPAEATENVFLHDSGIRAMVIASAMGLRQLFPVQTKSIFFISTRLSGNLTIRSARFFVKARELKKGTGHPRRSFCGNGLHRLHLTRMRAQVTFVMHGPAG